MRLLTDIGLKLVPTLAIIDGIKITMYYADHEPAHFHAVAADDEIVVRIADLKVIAGSAPAAVIRRVQTWAGRHQGELVLCSYDPFVGQAFIPFPHPPVRPVAASITRRPAAPRAAPSASWRTNAPLPAPGARPAVVPADVRPPRLIAGGGRASAPRCPIHGPSAGCPQGWDQAGYAAWRARHRRRSRIRSGARAAVPCRPLPRYGRRRITPRPPSARHPAAGCRCGCSAIGTPGACGRRRRSRSAAPGP